MKAWPVLIALFVGSNSVLADPPEHKQADFCLLEAHHEAFNLPGSERFRDEDVATIVAQAQRSSCQGSSCSVPAGGPCPGCSICCPVGRAAYCKPGMYKPGTVVCSNAPQCFCN